MPGRCICQAQPLVEKDRSLADRLLHPMYTGFARHATALAGEGVGSNQKHIKKTSHGGSGMFQGPVADTSRLEALVGTPLIGKNEPCWCLTPIISRCCNGNRCGYAAGVITSLRAQRPEIRASQVAERLFGPGTAPGAVVGRLV